MNAKCLPFVTSIIYGLGLLVAPGALAQLPATNMGRFVHQPGDNQYGAASQWGRHHQEVMPPPSVVTSGGGGTGNSGNAGSGSSSSYTIRRVPRHDVSIDPIVADEPIAVAGFPPLPDRLELPVAPGWSGNGGSWARRYAGGGAAPARPAGPTGVHQHYTHYEAGAFLPAKEVSFAPQTGSPGYYKCREPVQDNSARGAPSGSPGYYKARESGQDYYAANTRQNAADEAPPGMPRYRGASSADLRRMGKEPTLNDERQGAAPPAPPIPVVVNQAATQDLSLPEDEFSYNRPTRPSVAKQIGRRMGRALLRPINRVGGMAGIGF